MRKRLSSILAIMLMGVTAWAQAPKADLLDLVFNDDGSATDVSAMANTVKQVGHVQVKKSAALGINVIDADASNWSAAPYGFYRVDYAENAEFINAISDGATMECYIQPYWEGDLRNAECKPFSSHQGGGMGMMVSTNSRTGQNEWTFLPHVGGEYCWAQAGVTPSKGEYVHLVGVWDKEAGKARIYVNGELAGETAAVGNLTLPSEKSQWVGIGADPSDLVGSNAFQGKIAVARIYSDALTAEQVAALYQSVEAMKTGAEETAPIALTQQDGVYQISNADELARFAAIVNGGEVEAKAVLTADIDFTGHNEMIGYTGNRFKGELDGAYHTVTVNYVDAQESEFQGLVQYLLTPGLVKNVTVVGNMSSAYKEMGGIAGYSDGGTVSGCVAKVEMQALVDGDGTHGGIVGKTTNNASILNCIAAVKMRGELTTNCGGIVGWLSGATTVQNCLQISDIEIKQESGSATFCRNPSNQRGGNNYYLKNYGAKDSQAKPVTADQLASGEACYLLNGTQEEISFYQNIGEDELPTVDPSHKKVFAQGEVRCDGKVSGDVVYSNTETAIPSHQYENGFCTVCGGVQKDFAELVDGFYQIGTPAQFEWFAAMVNAGQSKLNARLTADLNYDGVNHTTIGSTSNKFSGHFDGQFHKILNIEAMLFGTIDGATIENLNLLGGTISQNTNYAAHTGSIAGACTNGAPSTLRNIYSSANMANVTTDCGGMVGKMYGVVEGCAYVGSFIGNTNTSGGMVGSSYDATYTANVLNCYTACPELSGNASYLGKFVGYYHAGNVVKDCYTLDNENGAVNLIGNNGGVSTNLNIVTADQFASGEIAYMLNGRQSEDVHFYQTIGTDAMPVIDPTHGVVYANGQLKCDGSVVDGSEITYANTNNSTRPDHQYENGVCVNCGQMNAGFVTPAEDGYYEVANADQLEWVSSFVNGGSNTINIRLTAPIDFSETQHTPIGMPAMPYKGTFDGQMQPITELNAMLFGTISGATITNVAIESGEIREDKDYAAHVGTIAGVNNTSAKSTISHCYSKADIVDATVDAGGFVGKMYGTIKDSYYAGRLVCTSTTGGFIGSSSESDYAPTIENCWCYVPEIAGNASYLGVFIGYGHSNTVMTNCYGYAPCEKIIGSDQGVTKTNVNTLTELQFNSGEACYILNGKSFTSPTYYQTIGEDVCPTFDETHGLVYYLGDGVYGSQVDEESLKEMVNMLVGEAKSYAENVVAQQLLIDRYEQSLDALSTVTTRAEMQSAYKGIETARKAVETSAAAYKVYTDKVAEIVAYLEENDINGPDADILRDYVEEDLEPSEDMPNGSYSYVIQNRMLSNDQIKAEAEFAQHLMEVAIANDIKPGSEITNLLANANLAEGSKGWQGKVGTGTGGLKDVMPVGECWNSTFDMYQTLTDMPNGVYELTANAGYRPFATPAGTQQAAMLYANDNNVYVMNVIEGMISVEDAINEVNCYITEGGSNPDYEITNDEGDVVGYALHGYNSCSYAFAAGRHLNRILVNVTDGQVKVGLKAMGSGQANDWTGFGNFRLFYRGTLEEAAEAIDETLAGQLARAATLLDSYIPVSDENYPLYPNYSQALKEELLATVDAVETATTAEEKYALVEKFSALFQDIYDCKMAYVKVLKTMENVDAKLWELADKGGVAQDVIDEERTANELVWTKYDEGAYTLEEALAMNDIKSLEIYKIVYGVEPEQIDGIYQIASERNLQWFDQAVNAGQSDLKAVQTAPLDLSTVVLDPIGSTDKPFTGSYDGQFYPIYNLSCMFFGTVNGATITRMAIESGQITSDANFAAHTGTIVGAVGTSAPNSITFCYSKADVVDVNVDAGGIAGKYYGTIENCYYAGSMPCTSTTGGILGSSHDGTYVPNVSNCHVYSPVLEGNATYLGVFAGYIHGGSYLENCYGLAGVTAKNIGSMGGASANVDVYTAEQFACGEIAYKLNEEAAGAWFQTLGEDLYPVLDATHGMVVKNADGTYGNADAIENVISENPNARVNVYDLNGRVIRRNVTVANSLINLPKGIYVVGNRKVAK